MLQERYGIGILCARFEVCGMVTFIVQLDPPGPFLINMLVDVLAAAEKLAKQKLKEPLFRLRNS